MTPRSRTAKKALKIMLLLCCVAVLSFGFYRLYNKLQKTETDLANSKQAAVDLDTLLKQSEYDKSELGDALYAMQTKLSQYEGEIDSLAKRVGTYQKWQTLDPELLQKYSKVYFLNENYTPATLATIDSSYVSGKGKILQFHGDALPFLQALLHDARDAGLGLRVASAYRSFKTQAALKSAYTIQYGSGANRFSADQGYSEHQLGTTVDFTTEKTGDLTVKFDTTPEFKWLTDTAYRYGFTLSYPKNNKYYIYEPWHWRFVGIALATHLYQNNQHLYDLDQRDIDQFLPGIFDGE